MGKETRDLSYDIYDKLVLLHHLSGKDMPHGRKLEAVWYGTAARHADEMRQSLQDSDEVDGVRHVYLLSKAAVRMTAFPCDARHAGKSMLDGKVLAPPEVPAGKTMIGADDWTTKILDVAPILKRSENVSPRVTEVAQQIYRELYIDAA